LNNAIQAHWTKLMQYVENLALLNSIQAILAGDDRPKVTTSGPERVEELDAALWEQMLRALGRALIDHQTDDWPAYFNHLRQVVNKVVTTTAISEMDDSHKAILVQRLMDRIDGLEKSWSASQKPALERPMREAVARMS
jgi:hypothetical protein